MNRISTAIIGMGRMGKTRYGAMMRHGGYDIVGICDSNENELKGYKCHKYIDWKECIDKEEPEIVIVCTVNAVIPDVVCYALDKGCSVFSEKPPGRNIEDTIRMKKCWEKHTDRVLKFGFNHRYHNSIIEAKSLIDSGVLGEVISARGVYGKAGNFKSNEWRNDINIAGGGILLDQGIHMLDLLRYFVGDFNEVYGFTDNLFWKDSVGEDTAFATLKTEDGRVATLHSSALQWKHKFDLDITLTNGYIALNGLLTSTKSYGEERITYYKRDIEIQSGKIGNPTEYTLCFDEDFSWDMEMSEFYDAVSEKGVIENGTINDAYQIMFLIDKLYRGGNRK